MTILQQFASQQLLLANAAEAIRLYVEPIRDKNDGWIKYPDGQSRPGMVINREELRAEVKSRLKGRFSETIFQEALVLCTVNTRSRARYFEIWNALQQLVAGRPKLSEQAHHIRHYYDLLLRWNNDSLQTAPTDDDPLFSMHSDADSGQVRVARRIDWQQRIDHHFYLLEVYGEEPDYLRLENGEYLYFDGPEIVD